MKKEVQEATKIKKQPSGSFGKKPSLNPSNRLKSKISSTHTLEFASKEVFKPEKESSGDKHRLMKFLLTCEKMGIRANPF